MENQVKKICGSCVNYSPMLNMMKGVCPAMPGKSFRGKVVMHEMDASQCPKFEPSGGRIIDAATFMESIPMTMVSQQAIPLDGDLSTIRDRIAEEIETGQGEKIREDRLVWEKHAEEQKDK